MRKPAPPGTCDTIYILSLEEEGLLTAKNRTVENFLRRGPPHEGRARIGVVDDNWMKSALRPMASYVLGCRPDVCMRRRPTCGAPESRESGIFKPSTLTVFMLIKKSNLFDRSMGRSPQLVLV